MWLLAALLLQSPAAERQGLVESLLCRDLPGPWQPRRPPREPSPERPRDLRKLLWPRPRSAALRSGGQVGEWEVTTPQAADPIQPLRIDPCWVAFDLSVVEGDRQAVLWSVKHFCWRLCTATEESDSQADESCKSEDGPAGRVTQVEVEIAQVAEGEEQLPSLEMDEGYQLIVSETAKLSAKSIHGFRRGLETLLQVFDALSDEAEVDFWTWAPGAVNGSAIDLWIEDAPKFAWRGLLLDTARHFVPLQVIESLLWAMAANKLNVLHWHLTDAMSFPLQLESLPQLAELGSFGPNKTYSKADVRHILALAANFSIRVVPELDMPAHTASWIFGEPEAVSNCTHVLPQDPNDAKNPFKARDKLALDVSSKRTKKVVSAILKEIAELFPDKFLHVGGDEVDYRCWTTMPHIRAWMRKRGYTSLEALQYFFDHVLREVQRLGKRPMVWQDSFDQGLELPDEAVVQQWKCWGSVGPGIRGWPEAEPPAMLGHASAFVSAEKGLATVQSSCWYLDWDSQWTDFYEHAADEGPLASKPSSRLLGGEAALWTERIDFTNLACRTWPRTSAVAERLWSALPLSAPSKQVKRRFAAHSYRLLRLQGIAFRPLTNPVEEWFQVPDLQDVDGACPLLDSQAIQRDASDREWRNVIASAFQVPSQFHRRDDAVQGESKTACMICFL